MVLMRKVRLAGAHLTGGNHPVSSRPEAIGYAMHSRGNGQRAMIHMERTA